MTHPEPPPQAAAPSLFAPAQRPERPTPDGTHPLRMLSALESNFETAAAASPRARLWIFFAVAVLLLASAFIAWQSMQARVVAPSVAVVAPVALAAVPVAAALPTASALTVEPARIETAVMPPPPADAGVVAVAAAAAVSASAAAPPPVVVHRVASASKSARTASSAAAAASRASNVDLKVPTALIKAKPAPRSNKGPDSDVELLEAMVAHLQGQEPALRPGASSADAGPQTIARLVEECKRLGPEQMRKCRQKICEGYWGRAQACPVELEPRRSGSPAKVR